MSRGAAFRAAVADGYEVSTPADRELVEECARLLDLCDALHADVEANGRTSTGEPGTAGPEPEPGRPPDGTRRASHEPPRADAARPGARVRPRHAPEALDGLQERRRLVLAGETDEAVLEAAHPLTHPLYRRHNRLTPAEHQARKAALGVPERPSPGPGTTPSGRGCDLAGGPELRW